MSAAHEPKGKPEAAPATPAADAAAPDVPQLQAQLQQAKDQYLRTLADVENTKKRLQKEKDEFARYAAEGLIRRMLPVLDSLHQALVAVDKQADSDAVVKGVHLIHRQLIGLLKDEGVVRITTVGEAFDPHRHEAVGQVEAGDGTPDNTILEEVQTGYEMHGKVIRPAMVKVAKTADTSESEGDAHA